MAESEALIGYGTRFRVSEDKINWTDMGEVTSVTPPNESVDRADCTHMQSPGRTRESKPGMIDPGDMSLGLNHIPGSGTDTYLRAWRKGGTNRYGQIVYPNLVTETFPCSVQGYAPDEVVVDDIMRSTVTLMVAGEIEQGTL